MLKNKTLPYFFVFILLISLAAFVPSAYAATWSTQKLVTANSAIDHIRAVTVIPTAGDTTTHFYHDDSLGFASITCTIGTTTCGGEVSRIAGYYSGTADNMGHEIRYSGNIVFGCVFTDGLRTRWFYSDNMGGSFSSNFVTPTTTNATRGCGADFTSAGTWIVAWTDSANSTLMFARTTNFGVSWTTTLIASSITWISQTSISLVARSSSEFSIVYSATASELIVCNSSNTGSSWDCGSTGIVSAANPYIDYVDSTWMLTYTSSNEPRFAKSTNGVIFFSSVVSSQAASEGRILFQAFSATEIYIGVNFFGSQNVAGELRNSTDGGDTWTQENACINSNRYLANNAFGGSAIYLSTTGILTIINVRRHIDNNFVDVDSCIATDGPIPNQVPPTTVGSTTTIAVNDLTGFDVDKTGQTMIARVDNGDNVTVYSSVTLAELGRQSSNCTGSNDMVLADTSGHVGFVVCEPPGDPKYMFVRTNSMNLPTFGDCSYCDDTIDLNGFSHQGGDALFELGEIAGFPLKHSTKTLFPLGESSIVMWSFSSTEGYIGVDAFSNRNNAPDVRDTIEHPYTSGSPDQICTYFYSADNKYRIGVVDDTNVPSFYIPSGDLIPATGAMDLKSLVLESNFGTYAGARGLSCAENKVAIMMDRGSGTVDELIIIQPSSGGTIHPFGSESKALVSGLRRGVAISGDGKFAAIADTTASIHIYNLTSWERTCTLNANLVGFNGMRMDFYGQLLWTATLTNITKYNIQNAGCTTEEPIGTVLDDIPGATTEPTSTGIAAQLAEPWIQQFGDSAGNILLGAITMIVLMISCGAAMLKIGANPAIGANAGLAIGVIVAWGLEFFNNAGLVTGLILTAAVITVTIYFKK